VRETRRLAPGVVHRVFEGRISHLAILVQDWIKTSPSSKGCDPEFHPIREPERLGLERCGTMDGGRSCVRTIESRHVDRERTSRESRSCAARAIATSERSLSPPLDAPGRHAIGRRVGAAE